MPSRCFPTTPRTSVPVLAACLALSACGEDRGSASSDAWATATATDGDDDDGTGDPSEPGNACGTNVGPSVVRRLTRFEYDNTVRDLLGTSLRLAEDFAAEEELDGFDNNGAVRTVGELQAEQYLLAAERLAEDAAADPAALLDCDVATVGEDACVDAFLRTFVRRAYRRPVTDEDRVAPLAVFAATREQGLATALAAVVQMVLSSPAFLYRIELGRGDPAGNGVVALADVEVASRLSYFLWGSMPDETLLAEAEAGRLHDGDAIAAQAERLLEDPRAHEMIADVVRQLLDLDALATTTKDPTVFPEWNDAVRDAMRQETERFAAHAVLVDDGRLATLLTARYTFLDNALASYYGIAGVDTTELPEKVDLAPDQPRGGLLLHGSLTAALGKYATTAPVQRGKFVRERLLCQPLPPPPVDVDFEPPTDDPDATMRERYAEHAANPQCAACHELTDPIGFGFEAYDGAGHFRSEEHGLPIDASGVLVGTDVDGPFVGAAELAGRLAESRLVHDCFATHLFRYALGRAETSDDDCTLGELREDFAEDGDLRALLVEITRTAAFRSVRFAQEDD